MSKKSNPLGGDVEVKFKASRKGLSIEGQALVDSGAVTSVFSFNTACKLGIDEKNTIKVIREGVGGIRLRGLRLHNVVIEANGRRARLYDIFVPISQESYEIDKKTKAKKLVLVALDRDEPPLLGQDFLQKSKAILDFNNDTLRGNSGDGTFSLSRKFKTRLATAKEAKEIELAAKCQIQKSTLRGATRSPIRRMPTKK